MFQDGQADKSDRMMRGVVRKNPNFAGILNLFTDYSFGFT